MGIISMKKYGAWKQAGVKLKALQANLFPAFKVQLEQDGQYILETLQGHIDSQDLGWTPLAESTIALKNGDDTILVETGFLRNNLKVRQIRSVKNGITFFIGADAWTTHQPSGLKMKQLMIYLEYGTRNMPARPLVRPTLKEVEPILKKNWEALIEEIMMG